MKTVRHERHKRTLGIGAMLGLVLCAAVMFGAAMAQTGTQYCEVRLKACPTDYDGETLQIGLDYVAISADINACTIVDSGSAGGVPTAVMFVIDHSGSMVGANGHDPDGNRFRVTRDLIDSIYRKQPDTEVGIVVFDAGLTFDSNRDANLVQYQGPATTSNRARQAYMPLKALNASAVSGGSNPFYPGGRIYDVYRAMFTADGTIPGHNTGSGTNISVAFKAALEAFSKTSVEKENQYIIFISDGEPNPRNCNNTQLSDPNNPCWDIYDFMVEDVPNTPTTYTVFLNRDNDSTQLPMILGMASSVPWGTNLAPGSSQGTFTVDNTLYQVLGKTAPETVPGMTYAIRNSIYSTSNSMSNIWVLKSDYTELLPFMMTNIMSNILKSNTGGKPKKITITAGGIKDSSSSFETDTVAKFDRKLPIDTSVITKVEMAIRYNVETRDEDGKLIDSLSNPDSLFEYSFSIQRMANPTKSLLEQNLESAKCGPKPTLKLVYGDKELTPARMTTANDDVTNTSPDTVKGHMSSLGIKFEYDAANSIFTYPNVQVLVKNADGTIIDSMKVTLSGGSTKTATFTRTDGAETAILTNQILEHAGRDNIILVFRNPEVPLDTIMLVYPYISHTMAFYETVRADGTPTSLSDSIPSQITITAGQPQDLNAVLINANGAAEIWGAGGFDPAFVTWSITNPGNGTASLTAGSGRQTAFSATTANLDYVVTATYKNGNHTVTHSITIRVEPGPPKFLQVTSNPADTGNVYGKLDSLQSIMDKGLNIEYSRDNDKVTLYAVLRDEFGNKISVPNNAAWTTASNRICLDANLCLKSTTGGSADARRIESGYTAEPKINVAAGGLTAQVNITILGDGSISVGPNPFVPGTSNVVERLEAMDVYKDGSPYKDIVEGGATVPGKGNNDRGILIVTTAPNKIVTDNGAGGGGGTVKFAKATVIIYDAVGNTVWRSKPNDVILAEDNVTFGFVWDGKNGKGRNVSPGTYLVRMSGKMSNGDNFTQQRKIGVTTGKKRK